MGYDDQGFKMLIYLITKNILIRTSTSLKRSPTSRWYRRSVTRVMVNIS